MFILVILIRYFGWFSLSLAPGTKIQLKNVPVRGGCLLLSSENVSVIGGRVEKLFDTWKLKQVFRIDLFLVRIVFIHVFIGCKK